MVESFKKRDRVARLLKLQLILSQYQQGIKVGQLAQNCSVSKRTVYRDLGALESELGVPLWNDGTKWGLAEGYFLPPISFSLQETMTLFLALRVLQNYAYLFKDDVVSTFTKLITIVPSPLKREIQSNLDYLISQERDIRINNYNKIVKAWYLRRQITINYIQGLEKQPREMLIDPYLIDLAGREHTAYVIAYSHLDKTILTFNIARIVGNVHLEDTHYQIPADFDVNQYMRNAWGVDIRGELQTVKLRFTPLAGKIISNTPLHPSQIYELQKDGSLVITLKIRLSQSFIRWVLMQGDDVKVMEPKTLRDLIVDVNESVRRIYDSNKDAYITIADDIESWLINANLGTPERYNRFYSCSNPNGDKWAAILFDKTRRSILVLLFSRPDEEFYLRQIVRVTNNGHGAVQKELKHLSSTGIVLRVPRGKHVFFQANKQSPIYNELKSLIDKTGDI